MEVQEQLDRQFGFEPTSTNLDPLDPNPIVVSKDVIQSSREKTAERAVSVLPGDDQATATALNSLALKHGPQQDKETLRASRVNSLSTSPESEPHRVPEPAPPRSRKRKRPGSTKPDTAPPPQHEVGRPTNRAVTKNVSGELSRPTAPLNPKGLKPTSYHSTSRNKFDLSDEDPIPESIEQPTTQIKKGRGRPRNISGALPNKDPVQNASTNGDEDLGSEEVAGDSGHVENGDRSLDEDRNYQDLSSASDQDRTSSHDTVPEDSDKSDQETPFSGNEDETDVIEEDDSENETEFELFGGEKYWDRVSKGAKTVGVKRKTGNVIWRRRPKIETRSMQDLVTLMRDLASLYRNLDSWSARDPNHETVEDELRDLREKLSGAIGEISESSTSENECSLIRDIYVHAIPEMVSMLRAVLICRSRYYSDPNDIERLKEVVGVQGMIIQLCVKARGWKAEPSTKLPIRGAVAKDVLPYMRELKEQCFAQELTRRTDLAWKKSSEADFHKNYRNVIEQRELENERRQQQILERRRMIYEQLKTMPRARGSRPQQKSQVKEIVRAHRRSHSITSDRWTKEQNEDLVSRLLSQESRHLPGMLALDL